MLMKKVLEGFLNLLEWISQPRYKDIRANYMAGGINLDRFCKDVSIKVSNAVTTGMIRPPGKKDLAVSFVPPH